MTYFNGSKDGYEKGFTDGTAGRAKAPINTLKGLVSQVVRPEGYTDTFLAGYAEGWRDGNRKRNGV